MRMLSADDVEFYEGLLVMKVARALLANDEDWDALKFRRRQTLLNRAVDVVQALLADEEAIERFGVHYRQHIIDLASKQIGVVPDPAGQRIG